MDGVDGNVADVQVLVEVAIRRDVASAGLDAHLHLQATLLTQGGDVYVRIQNLHVGVGLDITCLDLPRALRTDIDGLRMIDGDLHRNLLQVQDDIRGILRDSLDGGELVQHTLDLHCGDGSSFDGCQ